MPPDNKSIPAEPKRRKRIGCTLCLLAVFIYLFGIHPYWMSRIPRSVRSGTSRVKADLRSLATALENYYVDNNSYPAMRPLKEFSGPHLSDLRKTGGYELSTAEPGRIPLHGLTTPISYITELYIEPMFPLTGYGWAGEWPIISIRRAISGRRAGEFWPYPYYNDRNLGWIVWASGPDWMYDITNPAAIYDATATQPSPALIELSYDPTNGSGSRGDIWRVYEPRIRTQVR